jgi:protein-S-isoprenylcysteine O-methyltransferase Ste14
LEPRREAARFPWKQPSRLRVLLQIRAWALLLLALVCAFQLQRMKYEERVLFQVFPKYGDYMAQTARLMPGVY